MSRVVCDHCYASRFDGPGEPERWEGLVAQKCGLCETPVHAGVVISESRLAWVKTPDRNFRQAAS